MLSAHRRWQVFKGDSSEPDNLLFSVVKSSLVQFKTELDVILGRNKEENSWEFKVVGSWLERSWAIYDSNSTAIAQVIMYCIIHQICLWSSISRVVELSVSLQNHV